MREGKGEGTPAAVRARRSGDAGPPELVHAERVDGVEQVAHHVAAVDGGDDVVAGLGDLVAEVAAHGGAVQGRGAGRGGDGGQEQEAGDEVGKVLHAIHRAAIPVPVDRRCGTSGPEKRRGGGGGGEESEGAGARGCPPGLPGRPAGPGGKPRSPATSV